MAIKDGMTVWLGSWIRQDGHQEMNKPNDTGKSTIFGKHHKYTHVSGSSLLSWQQKICLKMVQKFKLLNNQGQR